MPLKPKVRKSDCLFCPTNTPKPADLQFIITKDKDKQQVLTKTENLELGNVFVCFFALKNNFTD